MSCPHSTREEASPDHCSQCLDAIVTRIPSVDPNVDVDKAIAAAVASVEKSNQRATRPAYPVFVAAIVGTHNDLRARRSNEEQD